MYDYLIKNGLVVDGSGKPAVKADVAVKGDKVARIAPDIQEPAAEVYDAAGKYVIPGLIDPHVHEEWYCFDDGRYESYIPLPPPPFWRTPVMWIPTATASVKAPMASL